MKFPRFRLAQRALTQLPSPRPGPQQRLTVTSITAVSSGVVPFAAVRYMARANFGLAGWLALSLVAAGCSDSESSSSTQDAPPPSVSINRITPVGAPSWAAGADCVEVGHDADGSVAVGVALTDAELRAPGACGARSACGHLVFSIKNAAGFSVSSASSSLSQTFLLAGAPTGVAYDFSVALVDDVGGAVLAAGAPVSASVSVTLAAPGDCGGQALSDAGSDAEAPDASSDAGSDAGSDASSDASSDAGADAALDAGSDAADAASDAAPSDAGDAAAEAG